MKSRLLIAALLWGALAPAATFAQPSQAAGAREVPLSRVIADIARRTPGRQLNTTVGEAGGRPVYFVQWQLANGRVVVFVVDRESGQLIGQRGG
jgi:uncharacterized membrane protein YkoI